MLVTGYRVIEERDISLGDSCQGNCEDVWELFADYTFSEEGSVGTSHCPLQIPSNSVAVRINRYCPNNTLWCV